MYTHCTSTILTVHQVYSLYTLQVTQCEAKIQSLPRPVDMFWEVFRLPCRSICWLYIIGSHKPMGYQSANGMSDQWPVGISFRPPIQHIIPWQLFFNGTFWCCYLNTFLFCQNFCVIVITILKRNTPFSTHWSTKNIQIEYIPWLFNSIQYIQFCPSITSSVSKAQEGLAPASFEVL